MSKNKTALKQRRNPFRWLFKDNYQYLLAFIIPFGILLAAYLCFGVYPISNRSVLSLDLNGQYVYYYDYMYDVFAQNESIFYSWSRNLSGEFMGIIGYYLASPFNFLVWIFSRSHITEGLLLMLITKAGAIGLSMSIYLYRGKNLSKNTTVVFSLLYALCSYTIVQTMNPMWLDGVMALPLVIYGVESLVDKGRFRLLIISLVYSFVTCFYIGYMIGIFSAIYFVYYFFVSEKSKSFSAGSVFSRLGLFFISAVVSVAISAFMLIPVVSSLSNGKFTFSDPDYSIRNNFNLINLLGKFLPNSYDTVRMEGLPFLYCGILAVIMFIVYMLSDKVKTRKKIAGAAILFVMFVSMYITPVDMMWHGGQLPNWLPYRYSFVISFLVVSFGSEVFDVIRDIPKKLIGISAAIFLAAMIYLESLDTFNPTLGSEGRDVLDGITTILPAMLILLIIAGFVVTMKDKIGKSTGVTVMLTIFVSCELFYNTVTGIVSQHVDITYSTRDSYVNYIEPIREVVNDIKANDDGFYRMEKDFFRTVNDPMALNMYGLSHSSSTLNDKPIALLGKFGLTSRSHYTRYSGATPMVDDLFGVKYILSSPENKSETITSAADISTEINTDAMPIAYLVNKKVLDADISEYFGEDMNVFNVQNEVMSDFIGLASTERYFRYIGDDDISLETENVTKGAVSGGHTSYKVVEEGKNAQLKYTVRAERTGEIFLWLPSEYERKLNVWINESQWAGNFYETDNYCVKSLGHFEAGDNFTVTLTLTKDAVYFKDIYFAYLDEDVYTGAINLLHDINGETVVTKSSPTNIRINVNNSGDNVLLTTIPVEDGWTVYVDGREAEITEIFDSLIGVKLSAGNHYVELKFMTDGYPLALYISAAGIIFFALLCSIEFGLKRNNAKLPYKEIEVEEDEVNDTYEEQAVEDDYEQAEFEISDYEEETPEEISEKVIAEVVDKIDAEILGEVSAKIDEETAEELEEEIIEEIAEETDNNITEEIEPPVYNESDFTEISDGKGMTLEERKITEQSIETILSDINVINSEPQSAFESDDFKQFKERIMSKKTMQTNDSELLKEQSKNITAHIENESDFVESAEEIFPDETEIERLGKSGNEDK